MRCEECKEHEEEGPLLSRMHGYQVMNFLENVDSIICSITYMIADKLVNSPLATYQDLSGLGAEKSLVFSATKVTCFNQRGEM